MYLIFDTETTGLPRDYNAPLTDSDNWPRIVQIAWQLHGANGKLIESHSLVVKPEGFTIPYGAVQVHHITTEKALEKGLPLAEVLTKFKLAMDQATYLVGHNIQFDQNIVGAEFIRLGWEETITQRKTIDTSNESTDFCKLPGGKGGKFKFPRLGELHTILFGNNFSEAHNAGFDVEATTRCFFELAKRGVITRNDFLIPDDITEYLKGIAPEITSVLEVFELEKTIAKPVITSEVVATETNALGFSHLHNHSQYSVLQSTTDIDEMVKLAATYKMPGLALTDTGNLYAAFSFWQSVHKHNKNVDAHNKAVDAGEKQEEKKQRIKCIIGTEINVNKDHKNRQNQDNGYNQVVFAKNRTGYGNLLKLSSISWVDGFYYVPRIDKNVLVAHKEGLIVTTGWLNSEIPSLILNVGETQAEEAFQWWLNEFGEDFYIELNRHNIPEENVVNEVLLGWAKKYNVKYIASNNNFYLRKQQARAHDVLLCIKEGEKVSTPIGRGRGFRYGLQNDEFYFKSPAEMQALFSDLPEAITTTNEIVEKVEDYKLSREVLLPKFEIPTAFLDARDQDPNDEGKGNRGENAYLRYLTYEGAKKKYGEPFSQELIDRIDFELATIERMGFPGYFLIVQDFTSKAREMGVSVGPGRGSAAGSAIAYCLGITNVDPIKYDLLFERFLNPDRISMPDIDIDFDDEGRDKVIQYVIDKYGKNQVAQIITYGTLGGKSAIRDTARVLDLPLFDADRLAKSFPDSLAATLKGILAPDGINKKEAEAFNSEQMQRAQAFRKISAGTNLEADTLKQAYEIEGCVRNIGVHACGVIITPDELTKFVPVATAKDAELLVTQYDNSVAEDAGLLKMDFLGLKTLTIIKDAVRLIKKRNGIDINPDDIPLDDAKTLALFQRGDTVGIFQFESPGMQKYLKELKPDKFGDLIAMNALYRPGPLEYIPNFIRRKHGAEAISYDFPQMEESLKDTYGITVYQEQVMLLSQKLAGFTKGEADTLRKAMGKKQRDVLDKMKGAFLQGCEKNNLNTTVAEKVWRDWEAFASYAFNKSHSTCYAYLAFHTAYLKAHYPAEFMAAILTNNMRDIKDVTFFLEECRRLKVKVLGPDINESEYKFTVNAKGEIRFGLGAIKGVGEGAVEVIVNERKNGNYVSVFDLCKRIDTKAANKKTLEGLVLAGALDTYGVPRSAYFLEENDGQNLLAKAVKFGVSIKDKGNSLQLFDDDEAADVKEPVIPKIEEWPALLKLNREKEVTGIFISGHPLNDFRRDILSFCKKNTVGHINMQEKQVEGRELAVAGIIISAEHKTTKNGKAFGTLEIEDFDGHARLSLFGEEYLKFKHFLSPNTFVFLRGTFKKRFNGEDLEFKITHMELLENLRDKMAKLVKLKVNAGEVTEEMIAKLEELLTRYKGKCRIQFSVFDTLDKMWVDMPSREIMVNPTNELLDELEGILSQENVEMA